jgi:hypothetical protein
MAEGSEPGAIVSMTTIPSRLPFVADAVERLLAQSLQEIDVRLYLPTACRRTATRYVLPERLTALSESAPNFSIHWTRADFGPATKLLGPLDDLRGQRPAPRIPVITVDDDVVLEPHALEELVEASVRHPGEALGFTGASGDDFVHAEQLAAAGLPYAIRSTLGGYRSILYPVEVLDDSLFGDYAAVSESCDAFLDDDHLFAWNLARRGITRRVIATRYPGPGSTFNFELFALPDSITHGPDGGASVWASHQCLQEYYVRKGWSFPP